MKRLAGVLGIAAVLAGACGPTVEPDLEDSDGDSISDEAEGQALATDSDGDGTPDYLDSDSDGDGIDDAVEAGDADPASAPVDSDGDGIPDFRDLDSDGNGRPDSVDGVGDVDSDGTLDFADLDDDGDNISDGDELGPDPAAPVDSDGDTLPDFRDADSDNDSIGDRFEGLTDFDGDLIGNYLDLDSDDDCRPDSVEAGGDPPLDSDGDSRFDFVDRDSDDDGIADQAEDSNCNGLVDAGETSPIDPDSDGDGASDLVESAAGTDPTNGSDNPQANGDFVFIEPFERAQSPTEDDLDFQTRLQAIDLYVVLDRSGSMSTEISSIKTNLATVVQNLTCPPLGSGDPSTCIPDLWAGAATVGYSHSGSATFQHHVDLQPNPNFSSVPITEPGSSSGSREPLNFALWASVTGNGTASAGCGSVIDTVPARSTCTGSPAQSGGFLTFGYPCFRWGALPVVLLATDEPPISTGDTEKCPTWSTVVAPTFTGLSAKFVGIRGDTLQGNTAGDLATMATSTGAVDAASGNTPLVFDGSGSNAAAAIEDGIRTLANGIPLDMSAVASDDPSDGSVDAVAAFVDHLETLQLGTADCASGLVDVDSNSDTFRDQFLDVRAGTPVCWKIVSRMNTTVPATDQPQLFRATISVFGDGVTVLDSRDVFFLVPPTPIDAPIE
jgi:hypothetical protein